MFNDSITVYNKYKSADGVEHWKRTTLTGVFWNALKGSVVRKTGVSSADSVQVIIPFNDQIIRSYKPPKAFATLADKSDYWTLATGDTIIKGKIDTDIVKSPKELLNYDDSTVITSVDTKAYGGSMSHFDISGK